MPDRRREGPRRSSSMYTKGGLRRVVTYLDPEDREKLRKLAHELEISQAEILRRALQAYLEEEK